LRAAASCGLACALLLLMGCPHKKGAGTGVSNPETPPPTMTYTHRETVTRLPDGETAVHNQACGCTVAVPQGWIAYRVDSDPTSIVRLEHTEPPVMRVEVFLGDERVPGPGEGFLDRGPYLPGDVEQQVTVWTVDDSGEPDIRRFGVMLPGEGVPVVVEGWLPYEDFEPAKRALDVVIQGIVFSDGLMP